MENNKKVSLEKIVKKIKELRRIKGFSNDVMAIELEMSTSAYNKLERQETALTVERFLKIKEILNVPFSEFFECGGNTYQQDLKDNSIGHYEIQNLHQENKEIYEKLIQSKDEQIAFLKSLLDKRSRDLSS